MDPKSSPTPPLDPKLKEAYDKVMNFNAPASSPPTVPSSSPTLPTQPASPTPISPIPQAEPLPQISPMSTTPAQPPANASFSTTPQPTVPTLTSEPKAPQTVVINNATATSPQAAPATHGFTAKKKSNPMIIVLMIFGAIIFIAVYAVIWVKIFNIKVPFLPF